MQMKFRTIQTMLLSVCLSACMTAFTGCSEKLNEQPETSSGDSSIESAGEYSTESSEASSEDTSDTSSESSEPQIFDEDDEIYLDQENLKTIDQDRLWVTIWLEDSYEAVREEYDKLYPDFDEDDYDQWHHWLRFLHDRFIQIGTDFLSDYGIDYDDNVPILSRDISVSGFVSVINGKFDKDTISLMLDDPRVWQIVYRPPTPYVPMY